MNKTDEIPYVLQSNGGRYYVEDAENDRFTNIQKQNTCAACKKTILFIFGFFKPRSGVQVASHFKHRPGDLEAC